jgi:molybdopterin/thiamine biosynthesis adenylyltransferase/nitroreductase
MARKLVTPETTSNTAYAAHRARILSTDDSRDRAELERLVSDPRIDVIDRLAAQLDSLRGLTPPPEQDLLSEPPRWVYYPWRRAVIAVLGPRGFRRARLDRNRNLITAEEHERFATVSVGVVGASAGHAIAHTLAAQGLCGELRLADFDRLELPNLNRVPATVLDLDSNKAAVAARRIAELDPYLSVQVMNGGLTPASLDVFLDGLDIVIEECDSLDMKVLVREAARARRLPVLMATSDRGQLDVERYDLDPSRPIFHGLLGDVDATALSGLTRAEQIPYVLRLIDTAGLSARGAASLIEIGHGTSTWPQLAGDVAAGAAVLAEAVRRIVLAKRLPSGRVSVDIAAALDQLADPAARVSRTDPAPCGAITEAPTPADTVTDAVAAAAMRAPSGGNAQPWRIMPAADAVIIELAPERTSTMDVALRGSAVALGAALFNARVAAAAHGALGPVTLSEGDGESPLRAVICLDGSGDQSLSELYGAMLRRETNRHRGKRGHLAAATAALLRSAAGREGARLRLLSAPQDICAAATILAETDRMRYLTPRLHADAMAELRWPDDAVESGIDVRSLELDAVELAMLGLLRRPDVMTELAAWNGGAALGASTRARVMASSAVGVVCVRGRTLVDYARGGSAAEAVWIAAQRRGLAVQPVSPVFLYAHHCGEVPGVSPRDAHALHRLRTEFLQLVGTPSDESLVLAIRLFEGPAPSVRSSRRTDTVCTAPQ